MLPHGETIQQTITRCLRTNDMLQFVFIIPQFLTIEWHMKIKPKLTTTTKDELKICEMLREFIGLSALSLPANNVNRATFAAILVLNFVFSSRETD